MKEIKYLKESKLSELEGFEFQFGNEKFKNFDDCIEYLQNYKAERPRDGKTLEELYSEHLRKCLQIYQSGGQPIDNKTLEDIKWEAREVAFEAENLQEERYREWYCRRLHTPGRDPNLDFGVFDRDLKSSPFTSPDVLFRIYVYKERNSSRIKDTVTLGDIDYLREISESRTIYLSDDLDEIYGENLSIKAGGAFSSFDLLYDYELLYGNKKFDFSANYVSKRFGSSQAAFNICAPKPALSDELPLDLNKSKEYDYCIKGIFKVAILGFDSYFGSYTRFDGWKTIRVWIPAATLVPAPENLKPDPEIESLLEDEKRRGIL